MLHHTHHLIATRVTAAAASSSLIKQECARKNPLLSQEVFLSELFCSVGFLLPAAAAAAAAAAAGEYTFFNFNARVRRLDDEQLSICRVESATCQNARPLACVHYQRINLLQQWQQQHLN